MVKDIAYLVEVPSIRDMSTASPKAPFGRNIRIVFDRFLEIAKRENFHVEDFQGYAMHVEEGKGREIIGILGHLDVVPVYDEGMWSSNPFTLVERDGHLYGRGVNDDKGPMIGCLYAMIILREMGFEFKRKVRLILGGAEETTWECMKHYFKVNPQPIAAFSPDGNFPIVNGEKGILYYTLHKRYETANDGKYNLLKVTSIEENGFVCNYVKAVFETLDKEGLKEILSNHSNLYEEDGNIIVEYKGERALSRNPDRAYNSVFNFAKDLENISKLNSKGIELVRILNKYFTDSIYGEKAGLYVKDDEMGISTLCVMNINYDKAGFTIKFDYRYPKGIEKAVILNRFSEIAQLEQAYIEIFKDMKLLYVNPNHELIKELGKSYKEVFNEEPQLISKGAASYARVLDNGVAFGPTVEGDKPNSHEADENIRIETLFKAIEVYLYAIYNLACK